MNKLIMFAFLILTIVSCKKVSTEPYGPTDIRIKNITTVNMTNVRVNTYDSTYNFGAINASSVSDYHSFDRAYPLANISVMINGQKYKTDTIMNYTYMQYLGLMKATYEIWVENESLKKLSIYRVVPESELK